MHILPLVFIEKRRKENFKRTSYSRKKMADLLFFEFQRATLAVVEAVK